MRPGIRPWLWLKAAALAGGAALAVLALGVPLLAGHGRLGLRELALLAGAVGLAVLGLGAGLLVRGLGGPLDRLLRAVSQLSAAAPPAGELPIVGPPEGHALTRAAVAFERLAGALAEERRRLDLKVQELTAANRALADARETLLRSETLATVGRLAAGLAHEVGNPLGAVEGYLDLARRRLPAAPDPELPEALDRIGVAAGRIDRTVRDLLDFARPSLTVLGPLDLAAAVEGALRLARVQPRFRHVEVELALPAGLPRVAADEHRLAQVLLNLLLNAGDAMRGAGRVRLEARAEAGGVLLEVDDEGPGIPEADLPRVFDPFFTTKEPGEGTGLGLAISHRLMESFGGQIAAGRAPGGGARFTLRFRVG